MSRKRKKTRAAVDAVVGGTPYDDVFRTLIQELPRLLILFVSFIFGRHYMGDAKVTYGSTEMMVEGADGKRHRRVEDSSFGIGYEGCDPDRYHLECQSTPDAHLGRRFFEYDAADAATTSQTDENGNNTIMYPCSAVVYLRPPASLKGDIEQTMSFLDVDGGTVVQTKRKIKVIRPTDYSLEEILQEDHLFLLPFYPFKIEKMLKSNDSAERAHALNEIKKLRDGLDDLEQVGKITAYEAATLRSAVEIVCEHLIKDETMKEGMRKIMGGKALVFEAKRIRDAALEEGREEGREEGLKKGREEGFEQGAVATKTNLVRSMLHSQEYSVEQIARLVGWPEETVRALT